MKKNYTFIILLMIVSLLISACGAEEEGSSAAGSSNNGTLKVGIFNDFVTLNPAKSSHLIDEELYGNIFDPLLLMTPDGSIEPNLITEWEISEDGKTYTFKLRDDVKFHDGTDFNAQAVIDNWNWILDPANASPRSTDLEMIEELTTSSPTDLVVQFKEPFSPFLATLTARTGMISSPAAMEEFGDEYDMHPTGTGAFKFESWNKNEKLVITKNEEYWQEGLPKLDQVEFIPITDPSQKLNALNSGQVDLVDSLPFQEIPNVEKAEGLEFDMKTSFGFTNLWINNTEAPFDNVHNRRALNLAINRDEINQLIYFGNAEPAYSHFSPASWANDPEVKVDHSIEAAKKELEAAGNPDGFTFKMVGQTDPLSSQLMQLVQAQLEKAGIKMEIEPVDSTTFMDRVLNGNFQVANGSWSGMVDPEQNSYAFDVEGAFFNWGKYKNQELEDLLQTARTSTDQAERAELYSDVASIMLEDSGYVFLVHQPALNAWKDNVEGYEIYPDQLLRLSKVSKTE